MEAITKFLTEPFVLFHFSEQTPLKPEHMATPWREVSDWMVVHHQIPLVMTVLYVVFVFGIKFLMRNRERFQLNFLLFLWNLILAVFSITGAFYTVPALIKSVQEIGFSGDMCNADSEYENMWVMLFCLSKIPEFLDTIFIVLRKGNLIFLHWYHHIATMWFCWIAWSVRLENGGMFSVMNLCVHSIMYSYYATTALKIRWSNTVRSFITSIQIFQMVIGTLIVVHNIMVCNTHPVENYLGLAMYVSYFILFVNLYIKSYVVKKEKSQ
eukprot:TRINITY_DN222_c0_g1_i1.p1 TRINITY_DN222_c0_g1~~TRINITY_DN222_c0_g1_i1.p1  ORF type:complete len:268 (+),score=38.76 TRINITY_DN222_c0_g1_i1:187-990(+)